MLSIHKGVYMQMGTYVSSSSFHMQGPLPPDNLVVRAAEDFHEV